MIRFKVSNSGNLKKEIEAASKIIKQTKLNELVSALKQNTPVDTGEARDGWKIEDGRIINRVEHIDRLNQGSSQQAPAYFVEQTLLAHEDVHPSGTIVRSL